MLINNYFFDIFRRLLKNIHTYHKKYTSFQRKSTLLRTPSIMPSLPESALIFSAAALITTLMTAVPRSLKGMPNLPTIYSLYSWRSSFTLSVLSKSSTTTATTPIFSSMQNSFPA